MSVHLCYIHIAPFLFTLSRSEKESKKVRTLDGSTQRNCFELGLVDYKIIILNLYFVIC